MKLETELKLRGWLGPSGTYGFCNLFTLMIMFAGIFAICVGSYVVVRGPSGSFGVGLLEIFTGFAAISYELKTWRRYTYARVYSDAQKIWEERQG